MDWKIRHDDEGCFEILLNGKMKLWINYHDPRIGCDDKAEAELLAIKIRELLGVENALKLTYDEPSHNWVRDADVSIQAAIDRIREAEKRLKPKERFVSLVCGGDMSCSSGVSLKMTSAQIDTNLAALQKVKEGLNE